MNREVYDKTKKAVTESLTELQQNLESHSGDFDRRPCTELVADLEHLNAAFEELNERFDNGRYGYTEDHIAQQIDNLEEGEGIAERFECSYTGKQRTFIRDLLVTDFGDNLFHYEGRYFASGPAVRIGDFGEVQEVIRLTSSRVQMDSMGLGYAVYCS